MRISLVPHLSISISSVSFSGSFLKNKHRCPKLAVSFFFARVMRFYKFDLYTMNNVISISMRYELAHTMLKHKEMIGGSR